jgi:hypothetical protein
LSEHIEKLSSGSTFSEASASLMKSIEITTPKSITRNLMYCLLRREYFPLAISAQFSHIKGLPVSNQQI